MVTIGRALMMIGLATFLIGAALYAFSRFGLPLGNLPGDIRIQRENFTCLFPLATMILVSIVLTVLLNIVLRILNR